MRSSVLDCYQLNRNNDPPRRIDRAPCNLSDGEGLGISEFGLTTYIAPCRHPLIVEMVQHQETAMDPMHKL